MAGFESSSSIISFSLYELALNPEVQNRVREEIKEVLKEHNNQVTYEAIPEMKYLDMVVNGEYSQSSCDPSCQILGKLQKNLTS